MKTFPFLLDSSEDIGLRSVVDAVASSCARYLREGGYLSDDEETSILSDYRARHAKDPSRRGTKVDFLAFTAEAMARKHSVDAEDEVRRMQKLLRARVADRIHTWTFGVLPGRVGSIYDDCPSLRTCCSLLVCPATQVGEAIVHVSSINPVAVLAAAKWVTHALGEHAGGEIPFVFPFMIDLNSWTKLVNAHFDS